jgi:hypothetical protein
MPLYGFSEPCSVGSTTASCLRRVKPVSDSPAASSRSMTEKRLGGHSRRRARSSPDLVLFRSRRPAPISKPRRRPNPRGSPLAPPTG